MSIITPRPTKLCVMQQRCTRLCGRYLVDDEQDAVLVAQLAEELQEPRRRRDEAALAQDRLHDDCSRVLRCRLRHPPSNAGSIHRGAAGEASVIITAGCSDALHGADLAEGLPPRRRSEEHRINAAACCEAGLSQSS